MEADENKNKAAPALVESVQSELNRLNSIYDTLTDIIYDISVEPDGTYRFKSVNQALCNISGLTKEQIVGRRPEEMIPESSIPSVLSKYKQAIDTKTPVRWEEEFQNAPGRMVAEITIVPVFDEKGHCTNLVGSYHDITALKKNEELIRLSEEKWRSFITKSPDVIAITSLEGVLEEMSPKALTMFGYDHPDEGIGKSLFRFIDPSYHGKVKTLMGKIFEGQPADAEEFLAVKKDGTRFYVEVNSELLKNTQGEPVNFINIVRDVTARKNSEKTISMLAHAVRSVSECVSITDMYDKILFVNSAFLNTYRYDEEELIGKQISMVRAAGNPPEVVNEILPATLRGGWHGELRNRKKDGTEFPVYLSTSVIHDENGAPVGLIGVTTDITERKKAEKELYDSEARNLALLSAIPDLMFMFNREGVFTDYHVKDPKLLLLEPKLFVGQSVYDVLPEELAEETMGHIREVFANGSTSEYTYQIKIDKDTWTYESRIVPCGKDLVLSIVRDITDQKKLEARMIESERLAALGEMSAGMAHEINQPLNTLSILFDNILLEAKENHSVSEEYLVSKSEKIFNNILRMKNIIDHVREFARSRDSVEYELFDINKSISNALSMIAEQYKTAGISLITSLSGRMPLIKGDTYKFERIMLNLILNAKDALLEKKRDLAEDYDMFIRISTSYDKMFVRVKVEDNGCGIRQEHMGKIFQPFFTTKETGKGTGLGLSISYGLIKEMNGEINIRSKEGEGTNMIITIPLNPENVIL